MTCIWYLEFCVITDYLILRRGYLVGRVVGVRQLLVLRNVPRAATSMCSASSNDCPMIWLLSIVLAQSSLSSWEQRATASSRSGFNIGQTDVLWHRDWRQHSAFWAVSVSSNVAAAGDQSAHGRDAASRHHRGAPMLWWSRSLTALCASALITSKLMNSKNDNFPLPNIDTSRHPEWLQVFQFLWPALRLLADGDRSEWPWQDSLHRAQGAVMLESTQLWTVQRT